MLDDPRETRAMARPSRERGFTILDGLHVLSLVAVLAAIGMALLARYVRYSKTAEAVASLEAITKGAAEYYDRSDFNQPAGSRPEARLAMRHFPPSSSAPVPANPQDVQGKKYKSSPADWQRSPWLEIRFSIPQPQCYAYSFESDGAGAAAHATAIARGDLDGDDVWSTYQLAITVGEQGTARISASIQKTDADE
jgi:type II secretory pathway pseudopilin PulG